MLAGYETAAGSSYNVAQREAADEFLRSRARLRGYPSHSSPMVHMHMMRSASAVTRKKLRIYVLYSVRGANADADDASTERN